MNNLKPYYSNFFKNIFPDFNSFKLLIVDRLTVGYIESTVFTFEVVFNKLYERYEWAEHEFDTSDLFVREVKNLFQTLYMKYVKLWEASFEKYSELSIDSLLKRTIVSRQYETPQVEENIEVAKYNQQSKDFEDDFSTQFTQFQNLNLDFYQVDKFLNEFDSLFISTYPNSYDCQC